MLLAKCKGQSYKQAFFLCVSGNFYKTDFDQWYLPFIGQTEGDCRGEMQMAKDGCVVQRLYALND